jgi:hypothetical protein
MSVKYGLYDKMKAAGTATAAKLGEINREYKITETAKVAGAKAVSTAADIDSKYGITQTATRAVVQGAVVCERELSRVGKSEAETKK